MSDTYRADTSASAIATTGPTGRADVRYPDRWAADAEVTRAEDAIYERRRKHWAWRREELALQVWHGVRKDGAR